MENDEKRAGWSRLLWLILLASLAVQPGFAVAPTAAMEGRVVLWGGDEAVAGITVTARGEDQPVTRTATSDSSGRFHFPLLPPGRYSVSAAAPGYSTVTLVGVGVVPGEERRVRIGVTRTDEEESVTETVNAALQSQGVDGGWVVPTREAETLPLLRGTLGEVAALFPVVPSDFAAANGGSLPLEAAGPASAVTAAPGAGFARVHENRLTVVPRWGDERMQGSVRLVRGENVSSDGTARAAGAAGSRDDWFRGALTLGGRGQEGSVSGFLAIDHDEWDAGATKGQRTAIITTAAIATSAASAVFLVAEGSVADVRFEDTHPSALERTRWSIRARHAWQISAQAANMFDLSVEDRDDAVDGADIDRLSLRVRERAMRIDERIAWLPGSRLRHELRAGVTARFALDARLTVDDHLSGTSTFDGERDESGVWLEDELMLDRLLLRGGLRVDRWDGAGDDTTDVAPRVAIAWHTAGENPLVLRGSWGRFHERPVLIDTLGWTETVGYLPDNVASASLRPKRTDRAVVGASSDLSGLAAWSFDVVSSRAVSVPHVLEGNLLLGDVERLEIILGGRLDVFGKADAVLAYTWSDTESDVPREEWPQHRGSLALRAALPADWAAAVIVRHDSGFRRPGAGTGAVGASTTLDLSLSRSFAPDEGVARIAIEAFNVTGDEPSIRSDRPARSLAVHLLYRFGE